MAEKLIHSETSPDGKWKVSFISDGEKKTYRLAFEEQAAETKEEAPKSKKEKKSDNAYFWQEE